MKVFLLATVTLLFLSGSGQAIQTTGESYAALDKEFVEHGGGCRKSSPPGQCCHMDNKAGEVHCH